MMVMIDDERKEPRRKWTVNETIALLRAYKCHKKDIQDSATRGVGFALLLADLERKNALEHPTTLYEIKTKIKNLLYRWRHTEGQAREVSCDPRISNLLADIFDKNTAFSKVNYSNNVSELSFKNDHSMDEDYPQIKVEAVYADDKDNSQDNTQDNSQDEIQVENGESELIEVDNNENGSSNSEFSNQAKEFVSKLDIIQQAVEERNQILENYIKEKLKNMERIEEMKEKRHREKIQLFQVLFDQLK